jgi:signal peptidase
MADRRRRITPGSVAATTLVVVAVAALAVPLLGTLTGRWRLQPVLSGSMAPGIPTGSLVLATPAPASSVRVGDVVIFRAPLSGHRLTAHRVIAVVAHGRRPVIRTKGDANTAADPWQARIEGGRIWIVRRDVPLLGYVTVFTQSTWPFLILVLGIGAIVIHALRWIWAGPAGVRPAAPGHVAADA